VRGSPESAGRARSGLDRALEELDLLYERLERDPRLRGFACRMDGECCRFDSSGPDLYMTFLEAIRLFGAPAPDAGPSPSLEGGRTGAPCPFLKDDRCSRRKRRALGCRIYACDPALEGERAAVYEEFHEALKDIHRRYGIPYDYREIGSWALRFLGGGGLSSSTSSLPVDR